MSFKLFSQLYNAYQLKKVVRGKPKLRVSSRYGKIWEKEVGKRGHARWNDARKRFLITHTCCMYRCKLHRFQPEMRWSSWNYFCNLSMIDNYNICEIFNTRNLQQFLDKSKKLKREKIKPFKKVFTFFDFSLYLFCCVVNRFFLFFMQNWSGNSHFNTIKVGII